MSYTRLKSLFGRLSRRNSSASETSRPSSPAQSLQPHVHSPLHTSTEIPEEQPVADGGVTQKRHSPGVAGTTSSDNHHAISDSPPQPPLTSPPSPVRSPRKRRPTAITLRASSVGHYDIAVTSESVGRYENARDTNSDIHLPRRIRSKADLVMATEREEERMGLWRGRVKDRDKDKDEDEGRGTSESSQTGAHTPGRLPRPSFSFLSKLTHRPKSGREQASVGRRVSEMFAGASPDSEHHVRAPTPGSLSTTPGAVSPLVALSTAGTVPHTAVVTAHAHGSTTLPPRLSAGNDLASDPLPLQLQPLDVLLMALTTPPDDSAPNPSMSATILAAQLVQHLRQPTSLASHPRAVVGAGPAGVCSAAQVGASVLANVVRNLRKRHARGSWEIVGAWIESMSTLGAQKPGAAIERALLWTALTEPIDEHGEFLD
ncbi:hypothetical protein FRC11_001743, partial [Ceratobasidium sp. 423]